MAFLESLAPTQFEGAAERDIRLKLGDRELAFKGEEYLRNWVVPNLYFHMVTAYNILRHVGVELGKADFLGGA